MRFELVDGVFVRPAVELEQRLSFSDGRVRLHQHLGDQGRFGNRGISWIVCWMTFASVASGVTKRKPIRNMISRCRPTDTETMPQTMLNFIHLNLKNTSHTTSE